MKEYGPRWWWSAARRRAWQAEQEVLALRKKRAEEHARVPKVDPKWSNDLHLARAYSSGDYWAVGTQVVPCDWWRISR